MQMNLSKNKQNQRMQNLTAGRNINFIDPDGSMLNSNILKISPSKHDKYRHNRRHRGKRMSFHFHNNPKKPVHKLTEFGMLNL